MLKQLVYPIRKWFKAKRAPIRRPRRLRLYCEPLEDRCLLSVTLSDGGTTSGPVSSPVTWTATATGDGTTPVYQFNVTSPNGTTQMVQDYSTSNSFMWNPMQQGAYTINVNVEKNFGGSIVDSTSATYTANPLATGSSAVVTPTANPLIALYSAPDTGTSGTMVVQFKPENDPAAPWESTSPQQVVPNQNTNFIVAGMLPNTTYEMQYVLNSGTPAGQLTFTTGSLPTNLIFPSYSVLQAPSSDTDPTDNMILHVGIHTTSPTVPLLATDESGNINWYYDPVYNNYSGYGPTLEPGGTILMEGGTITGPAVTTGLRQIDLLGDTLRDTNLNAVNAQLANMIDPITGTAYDPIDGFSHDALLLPNGDTAVLDTVQRYITVNGTSTLYTGDGVIVLNQNFQVTWVWDAFDWPSALPPSRLGTDGEGADDWLHANSISWSPEDGNLIVSLRSQDWVIKINYDNGQGDGHVIWKLGADGNFTLNSSFDTDPTQWFSHQHDAVYINDNTLVIFDDGNTRVGQQGGNSRGQEWVIDEQTMTATLVVNADLGTYSAALGSAQLLPNGNLDFTSGFLGSGSYSGQTVQVSPDGTVNYVLQQNQGMEYRSYFLNNLYEGNNFTYGLQDSEFEAPNQGAGASAYAYDPVDSAWTYNGTAGVAGNGSNISGSTNAPQGTQAAFIQETGSIGQVVNFLVAGNYQLSLLATQLASSTTGIGNGSGDEEIEVQVDGTTVTTINPAKSGYTTYTLSLNGMTAGSHTIAFVGIGTAQSDTALLDQVTLSLKSGPASASFLKTDTTTQGSWIGTYGSDGYNVVGDPYSHNYPSYAQVTTNGNGIATWNNSTPDPRALQEAENLSNRIAAIWYSSNSFTINVNLTDGQTHQVALYLLDWDNWEGGRSEEVDILDASTGNVLSSQTVSNFQSGEYLVWNLSGNVLIRVTNLEDSSTNAVISGLFFDATGSQGNGSGSATFVKSDTTTEGNWKGAYGSQGYNIINNATNYPSYAQVSTSGNSSWTWNGSTSDPRALQDANDSGRIAACWFSSTSYTINLNLTDGQTHQVALYLLDWDNWEGGRSEEVDILDASTGNVLSSQTVSNFQSGEYLVWNISGNVVIRVTNLEDNTTNAVVSGLFFDATGSQGNGSGSATFLKSDTTTEGNWKGAYGSQGYNIINNATNYPSYAQVSTSGNGNWTWNGSTSDSRALQDANDSGRIAAIWYSSTSFTINVNITDGLTHQVALYLLDWDNWEGGRSEEIDILDASSGKLLDSETASNFQNGEYLVWNLSGNVVIRVTNLEDNSTNAVISGLFFDPRGSQGNGSGSATFLKSDTTTEGNWKGAYGSQGYNIINNATNYPSYAQVSTSGNGDWTWNGSTSDPRALQDANDSGRIAAIWYSSTNFTINLNLTDGLTHQVGLYLLDWDNWEGGRSEEIDILDASTGALLSSETASNFQNGDYLVWNISGNVVIRVANLEGSSTNAVISGLFFDPKG